MVKVPLQNSRSESRPGWLQNILWRLPCPQDEKVTISHGKIFN